jgi:tetratricopeptide (TPR) repeat protein
MSITTKTLNHSFRDIIKFGCLGVLIGFIVITIVEIKISYQNIMSLRQVLLSRFDTGSEAQYLLGKASYAGLRGENEEVLSILLPNINKFTNRIEASEAYSLLGTAEYQLGHPQLAAGYFELMYSNNPTSHNLYTLALAYDGGGSLEKALEKYALVASFQDGTVQPNEIAYAQQRIQEIMKIKGINNQSP